MNFDTSRSSRNVVSLGRLSSVRRGLLLTFPIVRSFPFSLFLTRLLFMLYVVVVRAAYIKTPFESIGVVIRQGSNASPYSVIDKSSPHC